MRRNAIPVQRLEDLVVRITTHDIQDTF